MKKERERELEISRFFSHQTVKNEKEKKHENTKMKRKRRREKREPKKDIKNRNKRMT